MVAFCIARVLPIAFGSTLRCTSSVFPAHHGQVGDEEMALKGTKLVDQPAVLRAMGEESRRKGTASLSSRQIDRIIKAARARKDWPKAKG